jgi:pimeloyl-ACP methyl ester carboxylesterase
MRFIKSISTAMALAFLVNLPARPQDQEFLGDYRTANGTNISLLRVELGTAFFHFGTGRFGILHTDDPTSLRWYAGPGAMGTSPREVEIEIDRGRSAAPSLVFRDLRAGTEERAEKTAPYRKAEVDIDHDGVTLKATVSFPHRKGPSPALVLVHGGGPGPRSALEIWSNMYNRLGFACLTYDKREKGSGYATGPYWRSFEDLAQDAMACVDFLARHPEIDKGRIGLAAFSQGGWVVEIAAARTPAVSFLVMISCPVTSPAERDRESARLRLSVDGFTESDLREAADFNQAYELYGKGLMPWPEYKGLLDKAKGRPWFDYVEHVASPIEADDVFYRSALGRFYEPRNDLMKLRIPVLAIYGQNDRTVPPLVNAQRAMEYLRSSHERSLVVILPKANHSLIYSETGSDKELAGLNTYVKGYFELIRIWLEAFM